jgi:hypothetical protein
MTTKPAIVAVLGIAVIIAMTASSEEVVVGKSDESLMNLLSDSNSEVRVACLLVLGQRFSSLSKN